jgi:hypothetical protein
MLNKPRNGLWKAQTVPNQVIKYNQFFLPADQPMKLQYSHQVKLFGIKRYF